MGRKSKNTSFEIRQLVIFKHAKNFSVREIADELNLPKSTVYDIIKRFKREDRIESIPQAGQPEKLSDADKRFILRQVSKNPKLSAPKLATELNARNDSNVCAETVRRLLKQHGYSSRIARCKPFISQVNQKKRLDFAEKFILYDESYWDDVIFTDESKFNVFGSDGKIKVWRQPNTALEKKHLNVTVKHGGGHVMVWGCFSKKGVGQLAFIDGNMDANMYIDILRENLHRSAEKLGIRRTFKFYQDNDPKHKAHITREWLLYNCPKVLETPPQSPDINPIENLWELLDRKVRETPITSKSHLKERLQEEWAEIPSSLLENLISSMPRRLRMVIKAKGMNTKY